MILPTKYVPAASTTLGLAATILAYRHEEQTVSDLWGSYITRNSESTFDRFSEALTLLNLMGIVAFDRGLLKWEI